MRTRGTGAVAALAMVVAGLLAGVSPGQAETVGGAKPKPPRPSVTRLKPATGPIAGGTKVTVRGKNLTGARKVLFGTTKGRKVTVKNAHKLTVTSPAHAAGTVDIRVVTKGGKSARTAKDRFTYLAPVPPPPPPPPTLPTAVTAPLPAGAAADSIVSLNDVACPAAGSCFAVGSYDFNRVPLVERLVSGTWQATAPPLPGDADPGSSSTTLVGVSCTSSAFCVAAGAYGVAGSTDRLPFVETWDGFAWSVTGLSLPNDDDQLIAVAAVSCHSATTCVVVGSYQSAGGTPTHGLLETFDGANWKEREAPLPAGGTDGDLSDVDCTGEHACVAVGSSTDVAGDSTPLAETLSLSFTDWTATKLPLPANSPLHPTSGLTSVDCASSTSCVAAGHYAVVGTGNDNGLLEAFSSPDWTATGIPPLGFGDNPLSVLQQVSCASATACVAGGSYGDDNIGQRALVVTVDPTGATPFDVSLPSADATNPQAQVFGVGCAAAGGCGGVGGYVTSTQGQVGLLAQVTGGLAVGKAAPQLTDAINANLLAVAPSTTTLGVAVGTYDTSDQVTHGLLVTNVPLS